MKKINIAIILMIVLSFVIAGYSYQTISGDTVASHWNSKGEVNGSMSKFWGLFLMPFVLVGLCTIFFIIPKIDPLKKNIEKFRKYYDLFILGMVLFMFYVFILTILANLGYVFNMTTMMMPALALLFFFLGGFLKKVKRNWFIGIRTPWTISNDKVWEKTHILGAKLFQLIGLLALVGVFFPEYVVWIIVPPILIIVILLAIYSYLEYKKIK